MTMALLLAAGGAAAEDTAALAPQSLTFIASRNGETLGTHTVRIASEGGRTTVVNNIDLALKAMGVTVYRYAHHSTELWQGARLQSLSARTDDNGSIYKVQVNRQGDALRVDREVRKLLIKAPSLEQILPAETSSASETQPGSLLPTALWNPRIATQSALLNAQHGKPSRIQVSKLGRDTVRTSRRSVEATRYRYTGDLRFEQWFDDRGRWVKAVFTAPDGSLIDYTLQE
jgi:hypothetical protein